MFIVSIIAENGLPSSYSIYVKIHNEFFTFISFLVSVLLLKSQFNSLFYY